jgi:hypothetical protein
MSVEALEEVGVDPIMTRATAERLEWITALKVKAYFGGAVPKRCTGGSRRRRSWLLVAAIPIRRKQSEAPLDLRSHR